MPTKEYYQKHKEQYKNNLREYRKKDKDKTKQSMKIYRENNSEGIQQTQKRYREKHKEQIAERMKKYNLMRCYGITQDDYNYMFEEQKGRCAICGKESSELNKPLFVDHCHINGKIRGLLCDRCNRTLGMLDDKPELFEKAKQYLEKCTS